MRRRSDGWLLVLLEAVFLASRVLYGVLGVRFDASPLGSFWQYIDPQLLRHDFFRSLWYEHAQPPLYNLFLGTVLHGAASHEQVAFHAAYVGAGMAFVATFYVLLRAVGASRFLAAVAVVVVALNPGTAL